MLLLLISFLAGILTVLAPCVLPVLPVIVGGSISPKAKIDTPKDHLRPYVIAISLAVSLVVFTLVLKVSTVLVDLPADILNYISGSLLIILGFVSVVPEVWEKLVIRFNLEARSMQLLGKGNHSKGKYAGPILIGAALGPVFASCSPTYAFILASVLPHSFVSGLIYLLVYSLGLVAALLLLSLAGRRLIRKLSWVIDTHSIFRRVIGVIFIAIGILIFSGQMAKFETWVANALPFDESKVEQVLLSSQQQNGIIKKLVTSATSTSVLNVQPTPAPELKGLTNWINSQPLTLSQLKGKVVLVDFWTYSCINCIRTLPYLEKWDQTYSKDGLVIIGVNTPEFAFEHNPDNVAAAVKADGIQYPVALDNSYDTWNAYSNTSWPADYLIDKDGDIRYVATGEGDYDTTEKAIQELLGVNQALTTPTSNVPITGTQTPETYFGTNREQSYVGQPELDPSVTNYTASNSLQTNDWDLSGAWTISGESITSAGGDSTLRISVAAKDIYLVASGPSGQTTPVQVSLSGDGAGQYGSDAPSGNAIVNQSKLYHLASLSQFGYTTVTLKVPAGVSLYTFTFGS